MASRLPIRGRAREVRCTLRLSIAVNKTLMNNIDQSQNTKGRTSRPLNSRAPSASWGRVLGLVLLVLSAVSAYAGVVNVASAKFSSDLGSAASANGMVTVIVQYRALPSSSALKSSLAVGSSIQSTLTTIKAVTMT